MSKNPTLASEPEAVLTAWHDYIKDKDARPGDVIGQMWPGHRYTWSKDSNGRPALAIVEGITIAEVNPSQYAEVIDAIAKGQFSITAYDRFGERKEVLHKATGMPLKPTARHTADDGLAI